MPTTRGRSTKQVPYPATRTYSRAYLHHLAKSGEMLGAVLLSAINLAYYQQLTADARQAIASSNASQEFRVATTEGWTRGDLPPR